MQISNIRNVLSKNLPMTKASGNYPVALSDNKQDSFSKSKASAQTIPQISFQSGKNYLRITTFTGLNNPLASQKPAIQMKVTGVMNNQDNMDAQKMEAHKTFSVNRLADSDWKDGDPIGFRITHFNKSERIILSHPNFGPVGRVPDEISPIILDLIKKDPKNFKFELSNVIAGNTKGAATIGLRVNLIYNGKDEKLKNKVNEAFSLVLNDPNASKKALFYQPATSPTEILKQILSYEAKENGVESANHMKEIVENIVNEIEDPNNKKILLVGHCKPDGDTLGCILGLKSAINVTHADKKVDCSVDDSVTGLFRSKLPGIDSTIKPPYSQEKVDLLEGELAQALANNEDKSVINELNKSLSKAKNRNAHLNQNEKYDLVILMDIPSPARFSSGFKNYIDNANKTIYVDHHPFKPEEWNRTTSTTGVDMDTITQNNLAWVAERVPAATQLAAVIASKLSPEKNPLSPDNFVKTANSKRTDPRLNGIVAAFATGMWTDTGGFGRTANLLPQDIRDEEGKTVPVQNRPNFNPEGLSKWLFSLTNGGITKKWLRDEITYDIDDKETKGLPRTAREQMIEYATNNKYENKEIGLGFITASYDEMQDVMKIAQVNEPETNFLDIQNAFKYCEIMGGLKSPMAQQRGSNAKWAKGGADDVPGPFDADKIAVLICESEKAGELNTEDKRATQDALRFSFRSPEGTDYAELIANLFNGGGHGGAAGGSIKGDNININSTFSVMIQGKKVTDKKEIYSLLEQNYEIMHDKALSPEDRKRLCTKFELVKDEQGKTSMEIIEDVVAEMRKGSYSKEDLELLAGNSK